MAKVLKFLEKIVVVAFFVPSALGFSAEISNQEVFIHPFQDDNSWQSTSSALFLSGSQNFSDSVITFIKKKLNRDDIAVRENHSLATALNLKESSGDIVELAFSKDGIPICLTQVKAINMAGKVSIFGKIPLLTESDTPTPEWPSYEQSVATSYAYLEHTLSGTNPQVVNSQRCFFPFAQELFPVWLLTLRIGGRAYQIWADESKVYHFSKLFFDLAQATVQSKFEAFERDPVTNPEPREYVEDTLGKGDMTNNFFTTDPSPSESGISRAQSTDNNFIYDTDDDRFAEASVFVNVNEHFAYFKGLGYTWTGPTPLIVKFHTLIGDTKNNALYQPPDGPQTKPLIEIGDGDGVILRNLALDSDVVSHEFGHHIIFKTITNTSGESLVLHEGLADFFVFSRNEDPCLARSICVPDTNAGCAIPGQCLRTGANKLTYQDDQYRNFEAHFKGQLVSGFLVDLWKILDAKTVAQMTYNALGFMVADSGIRHLLIALLLVDYQMNQGTNACAIYDAALKRGFSSLLADVDCKKMDSVKAAEANVTLYSGANTVVTQKSKKRTFLGCSGFAKADTPTSLDASFFFVLVPFLLRRRRKT